MSECGCDSCRDIEVIDPFLAHQRKAGQSKSPKKAQAARDNLEKAREAKRKANMAKENGDE